MFVWPFKGHEQWLFCKYGQHVRPPIIMLFLKKVNNTTHSGQNILYTTIYSGIDKIAIFHYKNRKSTALAVDNLWIILLSQTRPRQKTILCHAPELNGSYIFTIRILYAYQSMANQIVLSNPLMIVIFSDNPLGML